MDKNRTIDLSSSRQFMYSPALAKELGSKIAAHTVRIMANKASLPINKKH